MVSKQSNICLRVLLGGIAFLIFSCTSKDIVVKYDKSILFMREFGDIKCSEVIDSAFTISEGDFLKFDGRQSLVRGSLCNEHSEFDSYLRTLQSEARLFYSGTFKFQQGTGYQIALSGHSGTALGRADGYLVLLGDETVTLLKTLSSKLEGPQLRSYFKNGFVLITRTFNHGYDVPSSKPELEPVQYIVVKMDKGKFVVQNEQESSEILKENFSDIEHY